MKYLEFDKKNFTFSEATKSIWSVIVYVVAMVLSSVSICVIAYFLIAVVFSTRTERRLREEIDSLKTEYREIASREGLIGDVITGLQVKDSKIYEEMFNSEAPNVDPVGNLDMFFGSDTIPDEKLISYTTRKAAELDARVEKVDSMFARIFSLVSAPDFVSPPMVLPVGDISYVQIGASLGNKINPFYKSYAYHRGLDIIVLQGEPVTATADGYVVEARRSNKGNGNVVEIEHAGGFHTRYAHLMEISVRKGQFVRKGARVGTVGMSGNVFSPHLHYEVLRDSTYLDPVNCIFASVEPNEYANMLFMAANTRQSMD